MLAIIEQSVTDQGLAFSDMWSSSEAAKAGLILLGDSAETFNGTLGQMQQSTGAIGPAFEKLKTNSCTIQIAFDQLKNTSIEQGSMMENRRYLGDDFYPAIIDVDTFTETMLEQARRMKVLGRTDRMKPAIQFDRK